ncbi:uncharacterized protein MELLADRAFT_86649 [Melampsora larici-populina 98AG31]|uniref:Uncharacterized protein n=1 Tax=Melampsora larici-populina (strain 98AG31 / pathotype 3-4-7) TaxID=747676 RepID=F4RMI9_MELLP|nr:uncharacterized protein MELLADRAFT_86649 [Melampsora larici-populina 98AG31]EGG06433.1 hypothetical protein MELLADRAFT_86649 [Melampsora larici-populina 98AG31]
MKKSSQVAIRILVDRIFFEFCTSATYHQCLEFILIATQNGFSIHQFPDCNSQWWKGLHRESSIAPNMVRANRYNFSKTLVEVAKRSMSQRRERRMKEEYQTLIIGTGLTESILSSSLDSTSILQIDPNPLYGSINWSTLSIPQIIQWSTQSEPSNQFINLTSHYSEQIKETIDSKQIKYHLNLIPTLLFTKSKLIDHFIQTGSSNSISFQLLNQFYFLDSKRKELVSLPSSKHDLFNSDLSLINKRKLVKLFQIVLNDSNQTQDQDENTPQPEPNVPQDESLHSFLASKPYEFPTSLISQLSALSLSPLKSTESSKQHSIQRIQTLLNSIGRYGNSNGSASSFLISQYGGTGEWIESMIRSSAIQKGATQIIGRRINSLRKTRKGWSIQVEDLERNEVLEFGAERLVIGVDHLDLLKDYQIGKPKLAYMIHRSVVLVESMGLNWDLDAMEIKHTLIVIDSETHGNPIQVLIIGSSSECCPDNQVIIYLSTVSNEISKNENPEEMLGPVLDLILRPTVEPLMKLFYTQQVFHHIKTGDFQDIDHQNEDHQDKDEQDKEHQDKEYQNKDDQDKDDEEKKMVVLNNWPEEIEDSGLGRLSEWVYEYVEKVMKDEFSKDVHTDNVEE